MGADQSKDFKKHPSIDALPDMAGCDTKGTILCGENKLTCMNGGVCALFLREVDDTCEERCKCPRDYIGDHCEFYAGFYSATIGLVIGLFLTILFLIFIAILVWYCCSRKKQKNEELESGPRGSGRAYIANRVENQATVGPLDVQNQTIPKSRSTSFHANERNTPRPSRRSSSGHSPSIVMLVFTWIAFYLLHYPFFTEELNCEIQNDSTSRSYSIYDNVVYNEDATDRLIEEHSATQPIQHIDGSVGVHETAQLLKQDSTDGPRTGFTGPALEAQTKEECTKDPSHSSW